MDDRRGPGLQRRQTSAARIKVVEVWIGKPVVVGLDFLAPSPLGKAKSWGELVRVGLVALRLKVI